MIISMIAAVSENGVIGKDGKLPWHIPAELARFRQITLGHTVVMGRRTFESIGRPLAGRRTIVLSKTAAPQPGYDIAKSMTEALELARDEEELFIIGGEEVFREAMPMAQRIYLTKVGARYEGEVHFPQIPESFLEICREEIPETEPHCTLILYEKVTPTEPTAAARELQQKGVAALSRGLYHLGRRCLEQARALSACAETSSHLALCIAQSSSEFPLAVRLAREAVAQEPDRLVHRLNLGRVQILAGQKAEGLATLREGLRLGGGKEFIAELQRFGSRQPPPLRYLPRSHPLNKYLGKVLALLGLR